MWPQKMNNNHGEYKENHGEYRRALRKYKYNFKSK